MSMTAAKVVGFAVHRLRKGDLVTIGRDGGVERVVAFQPATCATCEHFDRHFGDCHNPDAPRFQTTADDTCAHHYPSTT